MCPTGCITSTRARSSEKRRRRRRNKERMRDFLASPFLFLLSAVCVCERASCLASELNKINGRLNGVRRLSNSFTQHKIKENKQLFAFLIRGLEAYAAIVLRQAAHTQWREMNDYLLVSFLCRPSARNMTHVKHFGPHLPQNASHSVREAQPSVSDRQTETCAVCFKRQVIQSNFVFLL